MKITDAQLAAVEQRHDPRLRHVVARRPGRQVPDRAARARAGRGRLRLRVPLPRPDRRAERRWPSSSRSRARRPTRWRRCARRSARAPAASPICNVVGSMATRETDGTIYTHAGPEIGVASTKAFTSQLVALYLLGAAARPGARHAVARGVEAAHRRAAAAAAAARADARSSAPEIEEIAARFHNRTDFLYPRPRHQLPDRARRRAEAEGNLLHPRRGLSGRRDEARADRAHRRADAGRRASRRTITCSRR